MLKLHSGVGKTETLFMFIIYYYTRGADTLDDVRVNLFTNLFLELLNWAIQHDSIAVPLYGITEFAKFVIFQEKIEINC